MTTLGPRTLYTVSLGITRPPSADPEGGTGGSGPPLKNHKLYGLYGKSWTPLEKVGPPPPPPPLENVGPPLEPSKMKDFFEIDFCKIS